MLSTQIPNAQGKLFINVYKENKAVPNKSRKRIEEIRVKDLYEAKNWTTILAIWMPKACGNFFSIKVFKENKVVPNKTRKRIEKN